MADRVQLNIVGLDELNDKIERISKEARFKGARSALRKGAVMVADQVKTNAKVIDDPKTSEEISKNVAVRFSKKAFDQRGLIMFRVGIMGGQEHLRDQNKKQRQIEGGQGREGPHWRSLVNLPEEVLAILVETLFYWRFVEFGTKRAPAKAIYAASFTAKRIRC